MLKLGNKMRLTHKEQETFSEYVGLGATAMTVESFKAQLEAAARHWDTVGGPEAEFLAAITRDLAGEA